MTRYLFAIIIIGCSIIVSDSSPNEIHPNSFSKKMEGVVTRRCLKHKDLEYTQHVLNKLSDALQCKVKLLPKHTEDEHETIEERCFSFRDEVLECIKKMVDVLKICLYPEESYLPNFIIESFDAYTNYFCKNVRILTIEELLETNTAKCINSFMKYNHKNPHNNCYENIVLTDHLREKPVTKAELCEDLDKIYSCYHKKFEEHCADAPRAWEFESGLLNATRSPCYTN